MTASQMARLHFEVPGKNEDFYQEIRRRVQAHLEQTGYDRYATPYVIFKASIYAALAISGYVFLLNVGADQKLEALFYGAMFGISALLLALNLGHDAAHQCVSRLRAINRILYTVSFALLGVSGYLWQLRHNRSHHVFPNVNGCDIDIDENPFLRLSPNHPRRWYQKWQHLYAPFVYWAVALHTIYVQDFMYLFKKNLANMRNIKHSLWSYIEFIVLKVTYIGMVIIMPLAVLPFSARDILLGYVVITFVMSTAFIFLLIGTHFSVETEFPEVSNSGTLPGSWASHVFATSLDWSPRSRLANAFVGGANAHVAHHLFPGVSHAHYPAISRIIESVAVQYSLRYHAVSLPKMIASHFKHLWKMGQLS